MSDKNDKWEFVDDVKKKGKSASQGEITQALSVDKEIMKSPEGIIAEYKKKAIERTTGLKFMKAWYESQLDVAKYQLIRAVELKKKETDVDADQFLKDLNLSISYSGYCLLLHETNS